jgi:hypothetical protein
MPLGAGLLLTACGGSVEPSPKQAVAIDASPPEPEFSPIDDAGIAPSVHDSGVDAADWVGIPNYGAPMWA